MSAFKPGWYILSDGEASLSTAVVGPFYCKTQEEAMDHYEAEVGNVLKKPITVFLVAQAFEMTPTVSLKKKSLTLKK